MSPSQLGTLPTLQRSGNSSGPALLLIHGWAQDQRIFDQLRNALNKNIDVYSFDRRGYGASPLQPDLSQEHLDVAELAQRIDVKQLHVLGFSQGARIAARFASYAPSLVHKLIICGGVMDGFSAERIDHHAIDLPYFKSLALAGELSELRRQWLQHPYCRLGMNDGASAHLHDITQSYCARDLSVEAGHDFHFASNVYAQLLQQQIPTLFINGEYEAPPRVELAEQFVASGSEHRALEIAGAGHMAVLSHSKAVAQAIEAFIA
ncbi:alpha/beta hydrolase [SAR92 clade bacterium H455]|uniref:Alpha/beta hydrolase n=1 Tax=SAR92 clade bacterium H455 TaxID=2974818 RepID=A0ABY5TP30_9GAMM|nr:alpha/beta hydrolase [SAR92 clade bacterium H455]